MTLQIEDCFYLGHVSKVRGYKGEMLLFFDVDDPQEYRKLKRVLVAHGEVLHPFFIEEIQIDNQGFARTRFEGIDSREAATEISGKELYLPLDELPKLPDDQYYLHELKGMEVHDIKHGTIGEVEAVFDFSHNPLLQVFRNGYEVLIPIQNSFVKKVDKKGRRIEVSIPAELLEMNKI